MRKFLQGPGKGQPGPGPEMMAVGVVSSGGIMHVFEGSRVTGLDGGLDVEGEIKKE